ncbi:MAG: metallophosphoesterase family protein [Bacteroidales bacterium]|nr:metallophosphoesterase family protein [Bacteroidales bacterium]
MKFRTIILTAVLALVATIATVYPAYGHKKCKGGDVRIAAELKYRPDGKFKIIQFADTHYISGDSRSERSMKNVVEMLEKEKPDFVIFTGDVIFGSPAETSAREMLQPLVDRGIPFAVALGNHDSDFELSRTEIYKVFRSIPGNVNTADDLGLHGCSNDILTLAGEDGVDRVFYLFDSGNRENLAGVSSWGYVHSDQIDWYKRASRYFAANNSGKPVPSIAFQHIPVPEYNQAMRDKGDKARFMTGNLGEEPASPIFNSGQYLAMREMGDVQAMVTGHDHNNDFVLMWQGFFFIYGRYSGCDTVYNDLYPSGARVFEFTAGDDGFRTWVRVYGGGVEQDMYLFPGMRSLSDKRH